MVIRPSYTFTFPDVQDDFSLLRAFFEDVLFDFILRISYYSSAFITTDYHKLACAEADKTNHENNKSLKKSFRSFVAERTKGLSGRKACEPRGFFDFSDFQWLLPAPSVVASVRPFRSRRKACQPFFLLPGNDGNLETSTRYLY